MFINNRQHFCQRETFQSDYTVIINTSQADQFDEAAGAFDADLRGDNFLVIFFFLRRLRQRDPVQELSRRSRRAHEPAQLRHLRKLLHF
jgi:hypothetical protein